MFFNASLPLALAGPEGAQVVNGEVSFRQRGDYTGITASDKAIVNYSRFDIARPETVEFIQPSSAASVLNRILSAQPTNIDGALLANGRVFFVNPAGVYIGAGAVINVNQLVASGLDISNQDFMDGRMNFAGGEGAVINQGDIFAEKAYLIGKQVTNSGNISCPAGYVVMAAGDRVFLGEPGSEIVLEVDAPAVAEAVEAADSVPSVLNEGTIDAAGGTIVLTGVGDLYSQAISNVGTLSASAIGADGGQVTLAGGDGQVTNSGRIEASGDNGGDVSIAGGDISLTADSVIRADATSDGDGGTIKICSDTFSIAGVTSAGSPAGAPGTVILDPATATIDAALALEIVETLGGLGGGLPSNYDVSASQTIDVEAPVDSSTQTTSTTLSLSDENANNDLTINLNNKITLGVNQTLTGEGTQVNVSSNGLIQNGIDVAASDATVAVAAGTYTEDLTITTDGIDLGGASDADPEQTVIKGVANVDSTSWPLAAPNIEILGDDVKIHGFRIEGPDPEAGKYASGMVIGGLNTEVYSNHFYIPNASTLDDISQGIQTYHASTNPAGTDLGGLYIHNNEFTSLGAGTAGYEAIYLNPSTTDPTPPEAVTISDNTFGGALFRGITTERSNVTISGNELGTTLAAADTWQGILVRDYDGDPQQDITISNNTVAGFSQGIRIGTTTQTLTNIAVTQNTVSDNTVGVQVRSSADGVVVNNNAITGADMGVENLDLAHTLDATANWWGDSDPSDDVSGDVDYSPWWGGDYVGDAHVTPWTWGTDDFIQEAIDAASENDAVRVAAGTYIEDLTITTNGLDLGGASDADPEQTVIKGVANVDSTSWPLAAPNIEILGDDVKIHGFRIEGPDPEAGKYSSGMVIGGLNTEVYDNHFYIPNASTLADISQGIQTYHASTNPAGTDLGGLNIHDNEFTSLGAGTAGYEAIYINPSTTDPTPPEAVTIADNIFGGALFRGITTERSNVTISGNKLGTTLAAADTWQGILVRDYDGDPQQDITISNNTVQGFSQGIRIGTTTQTLTNIAVTQNTVSDNTVGVQVRVSADGVVVNNNAITGNGTGVENLDLVHTLDATANWWGDSDPSDDVSGLVDYSPWWEDNYVGDPTHSSPWRWGVSTGPLGTEWSDWLANYAQDDDTLKLTYGAGGTMSTNLDDGSKSVGLEVVSGGTLAVNGNINVGRDVGLSTTNNGHVLLGGTVTAEGQTITINSAGAILDFPSDVDVDLTAGALSLTASTGIGSSLAHIDTKAGSLEATTSTNGIFVSNVGDLTIGGTGARVTGLNGHIQIGASSALNITAPVTGPGNITLTATGDAAAEGDDLTLAADVTSTGAGNQISLLAGDDIIQQSGTVGFIDPAWGTIYAEADTEGAAADGDRGGFSQASDGLFDSRGGSVTVICHEDAAVASLNAGTAGAVAVTSNGGAITDSKSDAGPGEAANIAGASAVLQASTGIGGTGDDDIDTSVGNLEAKTAGGGLYVSNTGGLIIGGIGTLANGAEAGSGNIDITANEHGTGDTDDIDVQANIIAQGGDVILRSGDDILLSTGSVTIESGASDGTVILTSGFRNDDVHGGSILGTAGKIVADNITLQVAGTAPGSIGADGSAIQLELGTGTGGLNLRTGDAATGDIFVEQTLGDITRFDIVTDSASRQTVYIENSSGIIDVGTAVDAGADDLSLYTTGTAKDITFSYGGAGAAITTTGEVTLNATGAIRDSVDDSASPVVDVDGGTITLVAGSGGIGTPVGEDRVLEVAAATELNADTTADGADILINGVGNFLPIGLVDAGGGNVTLDSTGAISEALDDPEADIWASALFLTAEAGIAGQSPIETSATSITASTTGGDIDIDNENASGTTASLTVTTGAGSILFSQDGDGGLDVTTATTANGSIGINVDNASLTAQTVSAGGSDADDNVDLMTTGAGNVLVGSVSAADNTITIDSAGAIGEHGSDGDADLTAATLSLTANDGIGLLGAIETSATSISASTRATSGLWDSIQLNNNSGAPTSLTASTADATSWIEFDQTGGGQLTLADVATVDGYISITSDGDVEVGSVSAAGNAITIISDGAIDSASNDDTADIVSATTALTASSIGTTTILEVDTDELNANTSAASGDIRIDGIGDLAVGLVDAGGGNVTLDSTGAITDGSVAETANIVGNSAVLSASGSIGGGANADIETEVETLVASTTGGSMTITEADGLSSATLTANNGSVYVQTLTGDLANATVNALGTADLAAGGSISADTAAGNLNAVAGGDIVISEADDVTLQDIQSTSGSIVLLATNGAMMQEAGTTISSGGGSVTMEQASALDLKDYTFGNQANTDLTLESLSGSITAVDTANGGEDESAADQWQSIGATANGDIRLQGPGDITVTALSSTNGAIGVSAGQSVWVNTSVLAGGGVVDIAGGDEVVLDGSVVAYGDMGLSAGGDLWAKSSLTTMASDLAVEGQTIKIDGPIDVAGGIMMEAGDSIALGSTVNGAENIELTGGGDVQLSGDLESQSGGVSVISEGGKIFSSGDTLNVAITGNSDDGEDIGVDLFGDPQTELAAIVLRSFQELNLGSSAILTANGSYDLPDDRTSVDFTNRGADSGDAMDVAIYLNSIAGNVDVDSSVIDIASEEGMGTLVADAWDSVTFGDNFDEGYLQTSDSTIRRVEVVSRMSESLNEAKAFDRLPYVDDPDLVRRLWHGFDFDPDSAYLLRGGGGSVLASTGARVLGLSEPAPIVPPKPYELEVQEEVEEVYDEELLEWLAAEFNEPNVQTFVAQAHRSMLSTDLRPYKAAEKLRDFSQVLRDPEGIQIATVHGLIPEGPLSEERMDAIMQTISQHVWVNALTEYVRILSFEIGWESESSVEFAMDKYGSRLAEGGRLNAPMVVQMHLEQQFGG
jgi:filamentous hemagglutinin family protein